MKMKERAGISEKARSTLLGAALLLPALAAANPSCIDATNVHLLRTENTNPYHLSGIPSITSYVWGLTCGDGQSIEKMIFTDETVASATRLFIAGYTASYSSSKAASVATWSTRGEVTSALAANAQYNPTKFSWETPYPNLRPAMPFNGQNDDISIPQAHGGVMRALVKISYPSDPNYFAMAYVFPGVGNTDLFDKPLVVGDAFDPMNKRDAWQIYGAPRVNGTYGYDEYKNLLSTTGVAPRAKGYDVFFLDFSQGGGDILINAGLELKFLEWLQTQPSGRAILGGPSMSGIVSRLALLYSMPANNSTGTDLATRVKGYVSIDSPHQGASISPNLQYRVKDLSGTWDDAKVSWKQLSVPAAHEMLFGHFYNTAADLRSTASHNDFYNVFLKGLGDYRKDKPSVAIAYSNFFRPHAMLSPSTARYGAHIATVGTFDILVGGPDGTPPNPERHEMMPGSTADQFFDTYEYTLPGVIYPGYTTVYSTDHISRFSSDMLTSSVANVTEVFKGTFIPIISALDLKNFDPLAPPTLDETAMAKYSPFNKVIYMKKTYNEYRQDFNRGSSQGTAINDKRYKHIVFGTQLMQALSESLDYVERNSNQSLTPILSLLLQN